MVCLSPPTSPHLKLSGTIWNYAYLELTTRQAWGCEALLRDEIACMEAPASYRLPSSALAGLLVSRASSVKSRPVVRPWAGGGCGVWEGWCVCPLCTRVFPTGG